MITSRALFLRNSLKSILTYYLLRRAKMAVDCGCKMAIRRKIVAMQKGLCALVTVICFLFKFPLEVQT